MVSQGFSKVQTGLQAENPVGNVTNPPAELSRDSAIFSAIKSKCGVGVYKDQSQCFSPQGAFV